MNKDMMKSLNDLIKENLPEATSGALKEYLDECKESKDTIKYLKNREKEDSENLTEAYTQIEELKESEKQVAIQKIELSKLMTDLCVREKKLIQRENKVEIVNVKMEEAEKRADLSNELARIVFRNPVMTRKENGYDNDGNYDRTITTQETKEAGQII